MFGDQRAVIVAEGGGLRTYSCGTRELLDGFGAGEPVGSGRGQVLIPWPNRLEDGRYEFDGRRYQLPLNEPEHQNAIHGLVRGAAWTVGEHKAVVDQLAEKVAQLEFLLQEARNTLRTLQHERELAERIEQGIKQMRSRSSVPEEGKRTA